MINPINNINQKQKANKMKNYIEQKGIAQQETLATNINGMQITITSLYPVSHNTQYGIRPCVQFVRDNDGQRGMCRIDNKPELARQIEQLKINNDNAFVARYTGIDELLSVINDNHDYCDALNNMMDDEHNDGVNPPSHPVMTIATARAKYPIAAAYIDIVRLSNADPSSQIGYSRRCAGETALARLTAMDVISQQDIETILQDARNEIANITLTID